MAIHIPHVSLDQTEFYHLILEMLVQVLDMLLAIIYQVPQVPYLLTVFMAFITILTPILVVKSAGN